MIQRPRRIALRGRFILSTADAPRVKKILIDECVWIPLQWFIIDRCSIGASYFFTLMLSSIKAAMRCRFVSKLR